MSESKFLLPDVGEGLTEAEIVEWKVAPGDTVSVNQVLVEIETAKSLVELPSPFAGTVGELLVSEGQTVDVGTAIITVSSSRWMLRLARGPRTRVHPGGRRGHGGHRRERLARSGREACAARRLRDHRTRDEQAAPGDASGHIGDPGRRRRVAVRRRTRPMPPPRPSTSRRVRMPLPHPHRRFL